MGNKDLEPSKGNEPSLTDRETQPPLIVDLPDGQKLVVGDLDSGTVIEVATWRGTGRPDSRTNRLMLGVSNNEAEGISSKRSLPKFKAINSELSNTSGQSDQPVVEIENKDYNNQISTGVIYANVNPTTANSELKKQNSSNKRFSKYKKLLGWLITIFVVVTAIYILTGPVGFKFSHPKVGLSTALGSANSLIVLVRQLETYDVGQLVVSESSSNGISPIMAQIAGVSKASILLSNETGSIEVRPQAIHGKIVVVLPFIGHLARLIGK
jgi:hypothetical protein